MSNTRGLVGKVQKSLLILDLNGVLGHMPIKSGSHGTRGVYSHKDMEAKPIFKDHEHTLYERPNLTQLTYDLLIMKKKIYDVGVWSSAGFDETKLMIEHLFGRYYTQ